MKTKIEAVTNVKYLRLFGIYSDYNIFKGFHLLLMYATNIFGISMFTMAFKISLEDVDMAITTEILHWIFIMVVSTSSTLPLFINRARLYKMIAKMEDGFFQYSKSPVNVETIRNQINDEILNVNKLFTSTTLFTCFFLIWVEPNFRPERLKAPQGLNQQLPYLMWFPFSLSSNFTFYSAFIYQFLMTLCVDFCVFVSFLTYVSCANQLLAQIKILGLNYDFLGRAQISNETGKTVEVPEYITIKDCIKHHQLIISFFNEMQSIYGLIVLLFAVNGSILTCTCLYQMTDPSNSFGTIIKFGTVILPEMIMIFLFCWYGEKITSESEELRIKIYSCPWFNEKKHFQKSILLVLLMTVKPLQLVALGLKSVSLTTFSEMLQASYTYFNLLIAMRTNAQ